MWWRNHGLEYSGKLSLDVGKKIREEALGVQNTSILGIILSCPARPFWNHLSPAQCHTRQEMFLFANHNMFVLSSPNWSRSLHWLPTAAVTHYVFIGFNQLHYLRVRRAEGRNGSPRPKIQGSAKDSFILEAPGEICFQPFPASGVGLPSWVYCPFYPQGQQQMRDSLSNLSHSSAFLFFIYKEPGDSPGPPG